ncbi:glycosyltransferase family 2 protein [Planctobacterium marinum]|uniref:glycosyltransferase family 2 protein n=1 Tax=Planctobacterium marinum TaxID=1631968 RepID=UPI001E30E197|nr:glycosyltransferase family A protein [Planctobacterium marinum]MCC2605081.1 glycosyltransferase family 2 protein [Planctobacterium marinum]
MHHSKSGINIHFVNGLVSVIIPTHNRAQLLQATLDSVVQQSYRPIEILIMDDASQDDTREVVEQFSKRWGSPELRIHYQYHQYCNASLCRNAGLRLCRGEFIQFLDSDDVIHPEKLNKQVAQLNAEALDFVWSPTIQFSEQPDWQSPVYVGGRKSYACHDELVIAFINKSQWRTDSGLFRRSACIKTGLWSAISMFQDWDYHIRLLAWRPKVAQLNHSLSAARQHSQGRIGDKWGNGSGLDGALKALSNITDATMFSLKSNCDWQNAILTRATEIVQQSRKTNNRAVAIKASEFIDLFLSSTIVQEKSAV